MSSFFVTGTDTGVGKTVVSAGLARLFSEAGETIGVLKPAETGWDGSYEALPSDGAFLARAARCDAGPRQVVPFVYREPLAPLVAARREHRPVDPEAIGRAYDEMRRRSDRVIVEGAGGLSVPLTDDMDMAGLAKMLRLPLLVVARPTLGTLNHTFLTVHYAQARGLHVLGIVISGYRPDTTDVAEQTNPAMMEEMCGVPVLGRVPLRPSIDAPEEAAAAVGEGLALDELSKRITEYTQATIC